MVESSAKFFIARRATALLVDILILSLLGALFERAGLSPRFATNLSGVVGFIYYAWFTSQRGATPGKLLMRVEVHAVEGGLLSFKRASMRTIPQVVGSLALEAGNVIYGPGRIAGGRYFEMPVTRVVGLIVIAGTILDLSAFLYSALARRYGGTWHDVIARSIVVRKESTGSSARA